MKSVNIGEETVWTGKFLNSKIITYKNKEGKESKWEIVARNGNQQACTIIAWAKPSDRLIMIKQYRPSEGKYVIEFPAGLIDNNEKCEKAAKRELKEETGYTGDVESWFQPTLLSAGLTNEKTSLVEITIDELKTYNREIEQNLEEDEDIEVFIVPRNEIKEFLETASSTCSISAIMTAYLIGAKII